MIGLRNLIKVRWLEVARPAVIGLPTIDSECSSGWRQWVAIIVQPVGSTGSTSEGYAPLQENLYILYVKWCVLVHSGWYFQLSHTAGILHCLYYLCSWGEGKCPFPTPPPLPLWDAQWEAPYLLMPTELQLKDFSGMLCSVMARAVRLLSLSSVMLLHPRQRLELFDNIFAPPNSSGIRKFVSKFCAKIPWASGDCAS